MKLVVGNWKMEPPTLAEAKKLARAVAKRARELQSVKTVICPPFVFLHAMKSITDNAWCALGAQDVFWEDRGAYTGEISPFMLTDAGVRYVIIGHSERRARGETGETTGKKLRAALAHGLSVILCVGEASRDSEGAYLHFIEEELRAALKEAPKDAIGRVIVAYEPIWAVGAQALRADTPEELFPMVIFIRKVIGKLFGKEAAHAVRVLYGGSVNEKNAEGFLTKGGAQGLLVGRASLDAKRFGALLHIAEKS